MNDNRAKELRWIGMDEVAGLRPATEQDREQIGLVLAGAIIRHAFAGASFLVHDGDLRVPGHFCPSGLLLVRGTLEIVGMYDDDREAPGTSVAVLGDMRARDLHSRYSLCVQGDLRVDGLVVVWDNDHAFEVDGRLHANGLVIDDKCASFQTGGLGFRFDEYNPGSGVLSPEECRLREAGLRYLKPEYISSPGFRDALDEDEHVLGLRVDHQSLRQAMCDGRPVLRAVPGPRELACWLQTVLDVEADEADLLTLLGKDLLVDQLLAARAELSLPVAKALAALPDPIVQAWLQRNHPALLEEDAETPRGRSCMRDAARRAADPATDPPTVLRLAQDPDPMVRRRVAARADLPHGLIRQLAKDRDPLVRAEVVASGLNVLALEGAEIDALVAEAECLAAHLVKASLGADQIRLMLPWLSESGQLNLAHSLLRQGLGVQSARMEPDIRVQFLDLLLANAKGEAQSIAFSALDASQQIERAQVIDDGNIDLPLLLSLASPEFVDLYLAVCTPTDAPQLEGLGCNLGLSAVRQGRILAWARQSSFEAQAVLIGDLASNLWLDSGVLAELVRFCLDAGFDFDSNPWQSVIQRIDLPQPLIGRLIEVFGPREALSAALLRQRFVSPQQVLWALQGLSIPNAECSEAMAQGPCTDKHWFAALSETRSARLREVAAFNHATPSAAVERLLCDNDAAVRMAACSQPHAPIALVENVLDVLGADALDVQLPPAQSSAVWSALAARQGCMERRISMLGRAAWERLSARRRDQPLSA